MFAMKAIKSIKSIRGNSLTGKGPILASLLSRNGPRPGQEETTNSGGALKIAGTVAMPFPDTKAWFIKSGQALERSMISAFEDVHVCAWGLATAATTAATAAKNSPCSSASAVVDSPLLSVFFRSNFLLPSIYPFTKFIWYGQMSNTAGFCGAWNCLVLSPGRFRMVQEMKIVAAAQFSHQWVRCQHQLFRDAMQEIKVIATSKAEAAIEVIFHRSRSEHRRVMAEIESIPAPEFTQRFLRCVAVEATRTAAAVVGSSTTEKLSVDEVQAIQDYSGDGYVQLNESLRNNEFTPPEQDRVVAVIKAMSKVSKFNGKFLYRGTDLPGGTRLQKGDEFQDRAFLSTSRTRKRAFDKPYLFIINKCRTGVDIMKHSVKRSEQEVLFPPGTRFLITSVEVVLNDNQWKTMVEMEEISPKRYVCQTAL
jgi:ADP-ribosyltransferase exoenzyme